MNPSLRQLKARMARLYHFERDRDEYGQFSREAQSSPEMMRQAYVRPSMGRRLVRGSRAVQMLRAVLGR